MSDRSPTPLEAPVVWETTSDHDNSENWQSELPADPPTDPVPFANDFDDIFNDIEDYDSMDMAVTDMERDREEESVQAHTEPWKGWSYSSDFLCQTAPSVVNARAARDELEGILHPWRTSGHGHKVADIDLHLRHRLELMRTHLVMYTDPIHGKGWTEASMEAVRVCDIGRSAWTNGEYAARFLRQWSKAFILNRMDLPTTGYQGGISIIEDEDLRQDLLMHLQEIGKYVQAQDVADYMAREDVKKTYGLKRGISLATAKRWMRVLGYRWNKTPTGQYVDGHERKDIVTYRQTIYVPAWKAMQERMCSWEGGDLDIEIRSPVTGKRIIPWHHDESIFYAHDRRKVRWVHQSETPVPATKGEGASLMVADFVSADYGWLRSPDETQSARVLFKPGKNRDGYFDCEDIIKQVNTAMDILEKHFPDKEHVFIFDNATTHTKRADDAISARKMPKNTPAVGKNWGVTVNECDAQGKIIHDESGKPKKVVKAMSNGWFADGQPQSFYFPAGHPREGVFKGMAEILKERGLVKESKLRYECPGFKCAPGSSACCVRRTLYNQPDFTAVKSLLELACEKRGFKVLFLPKFHCELNFIEQCWGYAKRIYREYPPSKDEKQLQQNILSALAAVPLTMMRK